MAGKSSIVEERGLLPRKSPQDMSKPSKPAPVRLMDLPNKSQLFILALCRLSEPLSNTCLLPYIYYLIKSIITSDDANAPQEISKVSGLLVAAFPLAQFATSMLWGRASDFYGRKWTIVIGLVMSVIANAAFGYSRSIGALMFWRVLAGIGNGNVGVMRTMTAEIVKERKYQTRAFLILPLVFNSGMVVGLALGGCLADPVVNMPFLFGPDGLFNLYSNPDVSLFLAFFGMRETLPGKENDRDIGVAVGSALTRFSSRAIFRKRTAGYSAIQLDEVLESEEIKEARPARSLASGPPPSRLAFRDIWTRDVLVTLVSFGLLPLHNAAFMHIFPVFLSTPASSNADWTLLSFTGGLGLQSRSIGIWLSLFGLCGIFLQLFIYPKMQARLGTLGCLKVALFMFPLAYLFAPYLSLLSHGGVARWIGIAIILCAQVMARTIAIPSTVILLTESAPTKTVLGTVHGAGNMLSSLARAIGSAAGGWAFALGMEKGMVGVVWWCYLSVVAFTALAWSFTMRKEVEQAPVPKGRQDLVVEIEPKDVPIEESRRMR
ncbi:MFS general substrate transporter [Glarea lozoyensis ATCC 20868]|uniref:MFS general substrate transporter n=1 Tax=Glarea lozoyensis (strain ATCC 20868 / MF5171) TaxID=1116229 RepID=S3DLD9_GLAL2|nr:MFS general substrate transporter [Glarea lozoyensis ATCC 20868]EPE27368.1 MFS general substrate transporter [Glarea lozoyensis ATCC 20868]